MSECNFTQSIFASQCIGDSLPIINSNFSNLDQALCNVTKVVGGASPFLMSIRLSYSPTTATPTTDLINATTLYVHPYKGNVVTLWDPTTNRWDLYQLEAPISFPLNGLAPDTNYDIFLFYQSNLLNVEFVSWPNSGPGALPPIRTYQDGVAVKSNEKNKRLIGCLRTTIASRSEQSFGSNVAGGASPKQYLWNAQNIIPVTCFSFEVGTYYAVGGNNGWTGWRRVNPTAVNDGRNNRFSFIVGDNTLVNMTSQIYSSYYAYVNAIVSYTAVGINNENGPTIGQGSMIVSEMRGSDMTPRAQVMKTFIGGYNYLQMFENIYTGRGISVIMNENHQNQTGFLVSLFN